MEAIGQDLLDYGDRFLWRGEDDDPRDMTELFTGLSGIQVTDPTMDIVL